MRITDKNEISISLRKRGPRLNVLYFRRIRNAKSVNPHYTFAIRRDPRIAYKWIHITPNVTVAGSLTVFTSNAISALDR